MAGAAGLEPADAGVKVPCLNRLGYAPRGEDDRGIHIIFNGEKNLLRKIQALPFAKTSRREQSGPSR